MFNENVKEARNLQKKKKKKKNKIKQFSICTFGIFDLGKKMILESFQLQLVKIFLVDFSVLRQNRAIIKIFNYYSVKCQ